MQGCLVCVQLNEDFSIAILQQPIGTLQITSRDFQRVFQICKANEENSKRVRKSKEERFT
jgi:hypothetical protein